MIRVLVATFAATTALTGVASAAAAPIVVPRCGIDMGAPEIALAVATLRPAFRDLSAEWDEVPYAGNFDRCVVLSAALVTVERGTGSSPAHALFFHYGDYLGTATWEPYPFTSLNTARTSTDTVVLDYKDGRWVCTACEGPVHTVRYRWTGNRVEMLDPPPGP